MSTALHSPTSGRRRLRHELRRARERANLTQEQVAIAMDWSTSKVIRIETGTVSISTNDLRQLLQLYKVTDPEEISRLVELARLGRRRPWWARYSKLLPPAYLSYVGLEDDASVIRCFYPQGMPGLLQTEEFARALIDAELSTDGVWPLRRDPADTARWVELRQTRQREVLDRADPPELLAVLDEAVLRRQIGGPAVLRGQLLHLVDVSVRPNVTIRVLPFTAHLYNILSPFVILQFADPADTDVVFAESTFEQVLLDESETVATYERIFDALAEAALSPEASLELISRIADELA